MRKMLACLLLVSASAVLAAALTARHVAAGRNTEAPRPGGPVDRNCRPPDRLVVEGDGPEDEVFREILRIRREQGELLKATVSESPALAAAGGSGPGSGADDSEFAAALRRVAEEPRLPGPAAGDRSSPREEPCPGLAPARRSDADRLAAPLRAASRRLDRTANALEDQGQFRQADQLRELADRVRRQARQLQPSSGAPAPGGPGR
jgi:hypothetical protein